MDFAPVNRLPGMLQNSPHKQLLPHKTRIEPVIQKWGWAGSIWYLFHIIRIVAAEFDFEISELEMRWLIQFVFLQNRI